MSRDTYSHRVNPCPGVFPIEQGRTIAITLLAIFLLAACTSSVTTATQGKTDLPQNTSTQATLPGTLVATIQVQSNPQSDTPTSSMTSETMVNSTPLSPTASATYDPANWRSLPIIPTLTDTARQIYELGQTYHNNPRAFSKVGDCETSSSYFLGDFDIGTKAYNLGSYQSLQTVVDYFSGSFGRKSIAAGQGYKAATVLNSLYTDTKQCDANETPLACEYRLNRPSFAFIMFGTNDYSNSRPVFEGYMKQIIEQSMKQGILPILVTKADNLEGDDSINALIAQLAHEYDLPLWNFWAAVQAIPNHGLQADGIHLTYFKNDFSDSEAFQYAFPIRNLDALEVLNSLWGSLQKNP